MGALSTLVVSEADVKRGLATLLGEADAIRPRARFTVASVDPDATVAASPVRVNPAHLERLKGYGRVQHRGME